MSDGRRRLPTFVLGVVAGAAVAVALLAFVGPLQDLLPENGEQNAGSRGAADHRGLLLPSDRLRGARERVDQRHGQADQQAERRQVLALLRPGRPTSASRPPPPASSPGSASPSPRRSRACGSRRSSTAPPPRDVGIGVGDLIVGVDGKSIAGVSADAAASRIKGPPGTSVELTVVDAGTGERRQVEVERANVKVPAVVAGKLEEIDGARDRLRRARRLHPRRPRRASRRDREARSARGRRPRLRSPRQRRRPRRRGRAGPVDLPEGGPGADDRGPDPRQEDLRRHRRSARGTSARSRCSSTATPRRHPRSSPRR